MRVHLLSASFLVLLSVVGCAISDGFTAKIGIMVRLHGTDGAVLGAVREKAAGAAIMAAKHIRARNTSLVPAAQTLHPAFNIDFELVDTRSSAHVGVKLAVAFNEQGIDLIVGAARSAVSGPVALVSGLTDTPVLSYSSTAAVLATSTYPMFSRVIPNDAVTAFSLVMVCKEFGWTRIAILFIDDSYGQGYAQSVENFAAAQGVDVLVSPSFTSSQPGSIDNAMQGVSESGARVIFCIAFAQDMEAIAVSATEQGLVGQGYVWLTGDAVDPESVMEASTNPARMLDFLTGFLSIATKPLYGEKGERFSEVWESEKNLIDLDPLTRAAGYAVDSMEGECSDMCGYIYDAVWAAAFAVDAAVDYDTLTLDKPQLLSHLRELSFEASTGLISFDPETGNRAAGGISVIYQNWVPTSDGASVRGVDTYMWDADTGMMELGPMPVWSGGIKTRFPPPDGACESGWVYSTETLSCAPCGVGTYGDQGVCVACEVGKVAAMEGSVSCAICESGYAEREGMTECTACPDNSDRNSSTKGVSRAECLCTAGYYSEVPGGECEVCVPGAVCPGGERLPEPRYGFWGQQSCRQFGGELECAEDWLKFYECSVPSMCPGGAAFACAAGHEGRQCIEAADGWFQVGGSFNFECGEHGKLVSSFLIACVIGMWYLLNKIASSHYDALDIALLFIQTVGMISAYGFKWHPMMEYLNLALSVANFDVDFVTPLCLVAWSKANSFFLQLMLPLIFAALKMVKLSVQQLARRLRGGGEQGWMQTTINSGKQRFVAVSIMLYHTLCLRCFEVFRCEQYPDGNHYMVFAPDTQCWTPMHRTMMGVSLFYCAVIIVGTPLTLYLVVRHHKRNHTLHSPAAVKQWGFIHCRYEAEYKYWETMLVLRRGLIAFLFVFFDSPMLKGAFAMVGLTALLSAHVFTKPYIDSQIDILDFCSILGSMLYCLTGILSYPSITARTQGVICTEGAENPPECAPELLTKFIIAVCTLGVVALTLGVSVLLAWTNVRAQRQSEKAARIVKEEVLPQRAAAALGQTSGSAHLPDSPNNVSLCEMLDGRLLLPWAASLQRTKPPSRLSSFRSARNLNLLDPPSPAPLPESALAYLELEERVRAVPVDLTPYSDDSVAHVMRKLTEIHGLCDWLSCASGEAKLGLKAFVTEFVEFLSVVESEKHSFPLSEIVREEHLPLMSYWLMGSETEDMMLFWRLIDKILESGSDAAHGRIRDVLANMSTNNLRELEEDLQADSALQMHPWLYRRQHEMAELWRHQPDHMEHIQAGRLRRASLPLVESCKLADQPPAPSPEESIGSRSGSIQSSFRGRGRLEGSLTGTRPKGARAEPLRTRRGTGSTASAGGEEGSRGGSSVWAERKRSSVAMGSRGSGCGVQPDFSQILRQPSPDWSPTAKSQPDKSWRSSRSQVLGMHGRSEASLTPKRGQPPRLLSPMADLRIHTRTPSPEGHVRSPTSGSRRTLPGTAGREQRLSGAGVCSLGDTELNVASAGRNKSESSASGLLRPQLIASGTEKLDAECSLNGAVAAPGPGLHDSEFGRSAVVKTDSLSLASVILQHPSESTSPSPPLQLAARDSSQESTLVSPLDGPASPILSDFRVPCPPSPSVAVATSAVLAFPAPQVVFDSANARIT